MTGLAFLIAICLAMLTPRELRADQPASTPFLGYTKYLHYHCHYDVNENGTHVETHEWSLQVLSEQGLAQANQASVSFSDQLENAEILYAYTLKKDGRRIDVPPTNFQEESNRGRGNASPMFSDIRTKTVAFPDVAVGDTVVMSYRLTQREATFPGNFSMLQSFSKFEVYDDVQISLSAPESLAMRVFKRGVDGGEIASKDGRRNWLWTYRNRQVAVPESGAVSSLDYGPLVIASTFKDYAALAAAYESRARPKAAVTSPIRKLADQLTKEAHAPRDQAKALYEWVATNIQFAGNRVGVGSVVPHEAAAILINRMGDCKDHVTLLQSLLAAKGIASSPMLIDAESSYELPPVASVDEFDHVITYIPSLDLYADPTSRFTPFGSLPFSDSDKPVVQTTDFVEIRHTPSIKYGDNSSHISTVLNIHDDGSADGETRIEGGGLWASSLRSEMTYLQPNMEDQMVRRALEGNGYSGTGTLTKDDPKPLASTYSYGAKFRVADLMNLPGPGAIYVKSPFSGIGELGAFLDGVNEPDRTVNFQCEGMMSKEEYTIHLPAGVQVLAIPRNVDLADKLFTYRATYQRSGNTITAVRELEDRTPGNVCTPADAAAQKAFAPRVKRDLRAQILYEAKSGS